MENNVLTFTGSTIIYCITRKQTEDVADLLIGKTNSIMHNNSFYFLLYIQKRIFKIYKTFSYRKKLFYHIDHKRSFKMY